MGTSVADWISAGGTAGAALAAAYAAWKASRATAATVDLVRIERDRLEGERRLREVAELRAEGEPTQGTTWKITVVNEGPAVAKDVSMTVKTAGVPDEQMSRDRLAPQEPIIIEARQSRSSSLRAAITFSWTDSRGRHERTTTFGD